MNTGTKTASPVDYAAAKKIFDKLIKEKTAKGYTPGESGTPYQQTDKADRATGIVPQLLNSIDESEVDRLIADDAWWMQEKFDGKRLMIRKNGNEVTGSNRNGLVINLPKPIADAIAALDTEDFLLDGEAVGDSFIVFDVLQASKLDMRTYPYSRRYKHLVGLIGAESDEIRVAHTADNVKDKQRMLGLLRRKNAEGAVFKRHLAPYAPGRPASGGDWRKLKFTATASCIVAGTNGAKRSVKLELIDNGKRVGVGNVTIPANQKIPLTGRIVEIKYLYAFPGGSLYQPIYLGERDDIASEACTVQQLKFKAGEEDDN
jgi:bifunctional non-homologous end joining protein LigD